MSRVLHIVPGTDDIANGMAVVARMLANEQGDAEVIDLKRGMRGKSIASQRTGRSGVSPLREKGNVDFVQKRRDAASPSQRCICNYDEVWVHGMWLPKEWIACWRALRAGKRLVRMTHGSLSPLYLKHQSPFIKWLVGPMERWCLMRCDRIVATCEAEKGWIERYLGKKCPEIEVMDVKRFFKLVSGGVESRGVGVFGSGGVAKNSQLITHNSQLHLLYLGRRHPLKGVEYLEKAVAELNSNSVNSVNSVPKTSTRSTRLETSASQRLCVRIVSSAFGEELEKVWDWCDVLVLPTLSDNFGLVVAEALERGKCVITTDGAPAWGNGLELRVGSGGVGGEIWAGYGGRLIYLKGYRDGSPEERVRLLKSAIASLVSIASAIKGFYLHQGGTGSVPSILCGRDGARPSQ